MPARIDDLRLLRRLAPAFLSLATGSIAAGQCTSTWSTSEVGFGIAGIVNTSTSWDPDGSGPAPEMIAIGGYFVQAGALTVGNVVLFDPQNDTFSPLGAGIGTDGEVLAMQVMSNGDLAIAGNFTMVDGVPAASIARWDGSSWHAFASGMAGTVRALVVTASGDLVAGGLFTTAGGTVVNHIARWDGSSWQAFDQGLELSIPGFDSEGVWTVVIRPSGTLVAGGFFDTANGVPIRSIAEWDGSTWQPLTNGLGSSWLSTKQLVVRTNGELVALGLSSFPIWVMRLVGTTWVPLTTNPAIPRRLTELANGRLLATFPGFVGTLNEWNGSAWVPLATATGGAFRIENVQSLPGGSPDDLLVGGSFGAIDGQPANSVAKFVAGTWSGERRVLDGTVAAIGVGTDGSVYIGGAFDDIDGQPADNIARRTATGWQPLAAGVDDEVQSIAVAPDGDVYAVGDFQNAGAVPVPGIARWDGSAWHAVTGAVSSPEKVGVLQDGSLLVVGASGVARFDGTSWNALAPASNVRDFVQLPNGDLAASGGPGSFQTLGSAAIWDGTTWNPLAPGYVIARAMGYLPNGQLAVAAGFSSGDTVQRWDGTSWQPIGNGLNGNVTSLVNLANGDLIAGGGIQFGTGLPQSGLARWDGQTWQPLPYGFVGAALAAEPSGALFTAWSIAASQETFLSRLASDCPAAAAQLGVGCASSAGANRLTSSTWPQLGGDYRALGSALPADGLVSEVFGYVPSNQPLMMLLPSGQPGCNLLVDPFICRTHVIASGAVASTLAVPAAAALVGSVFHHQLIVHELDAQNRIQATTASNALMLTIGSFL